MRFVLLASLSIAAAACSSESTPAQVRSLDSPTDLAFGCLGLQELDGGVDQIALPTSACAPLPSLDAGGPDPADLPFTSQASYAFILETARGDVFVASLASNAADLKDSDPFTPGRNGLSVGSLPVGIATTPDGCWAVTANSGSCDLSAIHTTNAILVKEPSVFPTDVSTVAGTLLARPSAIVAGPSAPLPEDSVTGCPDAPEGVVYVAYPGCRLVARVDLGAGSIIDGVQFPPGGAPVLVGPDVTCPDECEAPGAPPDGGVAPGPVGEPSALAMDPDGTAVYVGHWNSPEVAVIQLDGAGAPVAVQTVTLEGAAGVTRLSATGSIPMGNNAIAGTWNFVYAIGRDAAIHVVDVTTGRPPRECDTQIDRRYLSDLSDIIRPACFPVGEPTNPPRRANARGPGIRLPGDVVPFDVNFVEGFVEEEGPNYDPASLFGHFAFVTALGPFGGVPRGTGYYITVNDANYPDIEDPNDARIVEIELAIPHTLRDSVTDRNVYVGGCTETNLTSGQRPPRIGNPEFDEGFAYNATTPRIARVRDTDPSSEVEYEITSLEEMPLFAPMLHRLQCDETSTIWEHQTAHPPDIPDPNDPENTIPDPKALEYGRLRQALFPDLGNVRDETWSVTWEGQLSAIGSDIRRTGAALTPHADSLTLEDGSNVICDLGTEVRDIVELIGCSNDAECSTGEECALHPLAPAGLSGMCVNPSQRDALLNRCEDLFVSLRRYTATDVYSDKIELVPRPRVMPQTPLDGCTDTAQCTAIHEAVVSEIEANDGLDTPLPRYTWSCEVDEGLGGPPRCIEICATSEECETGAVCEDGRCVLGPIPDASCFAALQRYTVRAGEAFVVIGNNEATHDTGYLHRVIRDPGTGQCVVDGGLSPLLVGRFHRDEPVCVGAIDDPEAIDPNPCRLEGLEEPLVMQYVLEGTDTAVPPANLDSIIPRPTWAIRFRSLGVSFDFVDVVVPIPWDLPEVDETDYFSPIGTGYTFEMPIISGKQPYDVPLDCVLPTRIAISPSGDIFIVDSGEGRTGVGLTRGQVLGLGVSGITGAVRFF
jgi:DNA-binding beta-propeller fold protein YncE